MMKHRIANHLAHIIRWKEKKKNTRTDSWECQCIGSHIYFFFACFFFNSSSLSSFSSFPFPHKHRHTRTHSYWKSTVWFARSVWLFQRFADRNFLGTNSKKEKKKDKWNSDRTKLFDSIEMMRVDRGHSDWICVCFYLCVAVTFTSHLIDSIRQFTIRVSMR